MIKFCISTHFIKVIRLLFNLININLYYPKEWKLEQFSNQMTHLTPVIIEASLSPVVFQNYLL